jgi:hypothetical protein
MAIGANDSSVQVIGGGLHTGVTDVKVTMINPTMDEMKKVGMNPQKEPIYCSVGDDNIEKIRVDFYTIQPHAKIYPKIAFFLENKIRKNKAGDKIEWINKFGGSAWSSDISGQNPPQYDWFKLEGARPALVGEVQLTTFIKNWANVDLSSQATLDNPIALAKGDLTELKALFAVIPNNFVQVLLGVKDGKYQDVYSYHFDRANRSAFDQWKKVLEKDGNEYKSDYQKDLKFQPFRSNTGVNVDSPTNMEGPGAPGSTPANAAGKPAYSF